MTEEEKEVIVEKKGAKSLFDGSCIDRDGFVQSFSSSQEGLQSANNFFLHNRTVVDL